MKNKTTYLTYAALIAAFYVILSLISNTLGLASGVIQVRISEALTILPVFTPAAIPGLFAGCIISNILTGCAPWDIMLGSLATLIGAVFTHILRKHDILCLLPPVAANTLILPWVLSLVYQFEGSIWYFTATIFAGELISCGILGYLLKKTLNKYSGIIKWQ